MLFSPCDVQDDVLVEDAVDTITTAPTPLFQVHIEGSKDTEARRLKKGKKFYYGYKKHVTTNKAGFINVVITTPANVSDMSVFPDLVDKVKPEKNSLMTIMRQPPHRL